MPPDAADIFSVELILAGLGFSSGIATLMSVSVSELWAERFPQSRMLIEDLVHRYKY